MAYKKCYYKLFNATTDTISQLQAIMIALQSEQLDCEEILTSEDSPIELESD